MNGLRTWGHANPGQTQVGLIFSRARSCCQQCSHALTPPRRQATQKLLEQRGFSPATRNAIYRTAQEFCRSRHRFKRMIKRDIRGVDPLAQPSQFCTNNHSARLLLPRHVDTRS